MKVVLSHPSCGGLTNFLSNTKSWPVFWRNGRLDVGHTVFGNWNHWGNFEHVKAFLSRFIMLQRAKSHKMKDSSLKVLNVSFTDKDICGVIFLVWCWCSEEFNLLVWSTTWCVENKAQNYTIMCWVETINVYMWK